MNVSFIKKNKQTNEQKQKNMYLNICRDEAMSQLAGHRWQIKYSWQVI